MSGFVGILNLDGAPVDRPLLERMTGSMAFRGPDAQNVWTSGPVGFGHTLLRTTDDTQPEKQPATLDGDVWIAADARVDGRPELLKALADRGRTGLDDRPDVELVLHAYAVWGDACVDHLIGDFAFALWDNPRRRLFCVRDPLGMKPFFYAHVGSHLVVSNTLDCVRLHPLVSPRLNDAAIADFLVVNYSLDPSTTVFADIQRLPPAHTLICADGAVRTRKYWALPVGDRIRYRRQQEYVERFLDVFGRATGDRVRTHRAGVFLSGGLDSPTVALAVKQNRDARTRACEFRAYNIAYERLFQDRERHYADIVARTLDVPMEVFVADDYAVFGHWDEPGCRTPEPRMNPLASMFRDHHREVAAHERVILTGYGGDPLFLYQTDVAGRLKSGKVGQIVADVASSLFLHRRLPPVGIRTTLRQLRPRPAQPVPIPSWINPAFAREVGFADRYREPARPSIDAAHPVRAEAQRGILHRKWAIHFDAQDPAVTGVPIEFRHPFFDLRVVNYLLSIPPVPWAPRKELLRASLRPSLPESIWRRPKTSLAGSPVAVLCSEEATRARLRSLVSTSARKYFREGTFPVDVSAAGDDIWTPLRPLALEYWLKWSGT